MAVDLLQRSVLISKGSGEIIGLLGEPSERRDRGEWVYSLGQCSGFGWEHSELRVRFASGGTVKNASFDRAAPL
jgi:hypothetical protein